MKTALIDIGSNSLRLMLSEYKDGRWIHSAKQLWTTRLGKGTAEGLLSEESMHSTLEALKEAKAEGERFGATAFCAVATSAMRDSSNGVSFAEKLTAATGIPVHIISGKEEASIGFRGAMSDVLSDNTMGAIIDLGGASTEVAIGSLDRIEWSHSYPIGAVRLREISDEGVQRIWEETHALWRPMPLMQDPRFGGIVGIGGTITTLAAIDQRLSPYDPSKVHGYTLHREAVEGIAMFLRYQTVEERMTVPGLMPGRADIIVAGAEILASFMDTYDIGSILVSEKDGLEGWHAVWSQSL